MAGLFGIGGSAAKTDRSQQLQSWGDLNQLFNQQSQFGFGQEQAGAQGLGASSNYFSALMSGDPAKMSAALAPQISTIQGQASQNINTLGQFTGRSGGTASAQVAAETEAGTAVQNLFDLLGPEAATELAAISGTQESLGQAAVGLGESAASTAGAQASNARQTDVPVQQAQQAAVMEAIASLAGMA